MRIIFAILLLLAASTPVLAQLPEPERHPFEGGTITITETNTGEKEVAFDGRLLGSNYFASFDQEIEVGGSRVALISLGDGGNACGPGTLIVWKDGGEVTSDFIGEDCGAPWPAVAPDRLYFVPYLRPGASGDVVTWSPDERIRIAGSLTFKPQPNTGWADLEAGKVGHIMETFQNESVYRAAAALLGGDLEAVATGLSVGSGAETLPSGVIWSSGCIPHNCGAGNSFMAIDPKSEKLYFAQQSDGPTPRSWPPVSEWPKDVRDAMVGAIGR